MPLGLKRNPQNPGNLLIEESEVETVKALFRAYLKTKNLKSTCRELNQAGFRTKAYINKKGEAKGGNHFTVQSLHHLLTNAAFVGHREINKKRGDVRLAKAAWPAIVDEKDFEKVQKILEGNRRRYKPDEWKTYPYPLTGITICGECGQPMCGKSAHGKNNKHHYYDHPRMPKASGSDLRFFIRHFVSISHIIDPPLEFPVRIFRKTELTEL